MGLGKDVFRLRKEGQWRKARGRLLNVKYKAIELVLGSEGCAGTTSAREHLLLLVAPPLWFSASELPAGARRWECVCPVTVYWCCLAPGGVVVGGGGLARVLEFALGQRRGWAPRVTCRAGGAAVGLATCGMGVSGTGDPALATRSWVLLGGCSRLQDCPQTPPGT